MVNFVLEDRRPQRGRIRRALKQWALAGMLAAPVLYVGYNVVTVALVAEGAKGKASPALHAPVYGLKELKR